MGLVCMNAFMYVRTTYVSLRVPVCMYACICMYVCIYVYVGIHVCVCVCVCVCVSSASANYKNNVICYWSISQSLRKVGRHGCQSDFIFVLVQGAY